MAFTSLFTLVAIAAVSSAAPANKRATCPDGSTVSNAACCAFIPLAQDLQQTVFQNECGEDGKALCLSKYGVFSDNSFVQLTR